VKDVVNTYQFDGLRVDTTPEVKKPFWKEYSASAGVFTIGEVFNGDIGYVSSFQGAALDATLNYPLYFTLKEVFDYGKSMYSIRDTLHYEGQFFSDVSVLGTFLDNHDNPRFLNLNGNHQLLKSGLTYALFAQGIPIVYYGTEQGFDGGNDPYDRMPLWTTGLSTNGELYKYIGLLNKVRSENKVWENPHVERWCDDTFYAFTRGEVLVALTNQVDGQQERNIAYHPYTSG